MMKRLQWVLLIGSLLFLVFLTISCNKDMQHVVWYALAPNWVHLIVVDSEGGWIVVAGMPNSAVDSYRNNLAADGLESDIPGAVQHMFGISGAGFLRGGRTAWAAVARDVFGTGAHIPSSNKVVAASIPALALDLQKNGLPDTLAELVGPGTTMEDIANAVQLLARPEMVVHYYDLEMIFPETMNHTLFSQWLREWTRLTIRYAERYTGE